MQIEGLKRKRHKYKGRETSHMHTAQTEKMRKLTQKNHLLDIFFKRKLK